MTAPKQTVEYIVRADRPLSLDPRDPRTPALADVARSDMVLYEITSSRTLDVSEQILTAGLDRTIDGASTLRVSLIDKTDTLIRHPLLRRNSQGLWRTRVVLDSIVFHLVNVGRPAARRVDLTFEEQAYNALRRHDNPLVGSRGKYTRAQFVKRMCDEAGVDLISPELREKQDVAEAEQPDTGGTAGTDTSTADRNREPGFAAHAKIGITSGGVFYPADAGQRANGAKVIGTARACSAGPKATLALVEATIVEPGKTLSRFWTNSAEQNDHDSVGILQARVRYVPFEKAMDIEYVCTRFLKGPSFTGNYGGAGAIELAKRFPEWTAGKIAQTIQGSAFPSRYDEQHDNAARLIAAYTGGAVDLADDSTAGVLSNDADDTYAVPYEFSRGDDGQREDSVTCIRRLADEVAWYFFVVAATAYYVSGNYLIRSRPRMLVAPGEEGIEEVTFSLDESAKVEDQVTVQCRARRWQAPPGSVVDVDGYGDADGRWLVGQISRPKLFTSDLATVTLVRAKKKKPEPAHEIRQREQESGVTVGDDSEGAVNVPGVGSDSTYKGGSWPAPPGGAAGFQGPEHSLLYHLAGVGVNDFHLTVTATTNGNHVRNSNHFAGRAFDISGSEANMHAFSQYVASNFTPRLLELIHNPGFGVKNGQTVDGASVFAKVWEGHKNHVHVAA